MPEENPDERSPATRFWVWFFFVALGALLLAVWLLSLGAKGDEIGGALGPSLAILSIFAPIIIDRLSREQNRPRLPLPSRKLLMFATATLLGVGLSAAYWFWYHKGDVNVTDRISVSNGTRLHNGGVATLQIPDSPDREKISLTLTLTSNHPEIGDCVVPAALRLKLTVDGRDWGGATARSGQEVRLSLGKVERSAALTAAVSIPDPTCSVDLRVAEAILFNQEIL
ncbi:hypothetical protein [Actinomadura kijaniata]|uniref:hypothetical protein n=1 Tax=Actinomadura kijaniata TaxID=46161 RepID=UPI003F530525